MPACLEAASGELSQIDVQLEQAQRHIQTHGANLLINLLRGKNAETAQRFLGRCEACQRQREELSRVVVAIPMLIASN